MNVEFRIDEKTVESAFLLTLYDIIEELNCKSTTILEDYYNKELKKYCKIRIINVYGSSVMVSWLVLRVQRYLYLVDQLKENNSIISDLYLSDEK